MKLNFKKIVPVLTGAILLGSTIGLATSVAGADVTYPSSFSDAVVVIGSASNDAAPANDIAADLGKLSSSTSLSGENVKIQSSANNLNVGDNLKTVLGSSVDYTDLPVLLKKTTFQAKGGNQYDYEQELTLAGMTFTNVKDDDFSDEPFVGVKLLDGAQVLNYTLTFTKDAESTVDTATNHMTDFEDTDIEILGKSYTILNAYNGTTVKLELMGGAKNDILEEGAKKDLVVNGKTYSVEISYIGSTEVKLIVGDETTTSLSEGDTYELNDGTEIGIRDIMYDSKTGSVSKVEFTLGAEKLVLEDGVEVELADETVSGLTAHIAHTHVSATKTSISEIKLVWDVDDNEAIFKDRVLEFPGLKSLKLQAGDLTIPLTEKTSVQNDGDDKISITFPFESGSKTFDLLYGNGTTFTYLGKSATDQLMSASTNIAFNESRDQYFVVTYVDGVTSESYLLDAKVTESDNENYTAIRDAVSGEYFCQDKKVGATCKIGSTVLTVTALHKDNKITNLTSPNANTFNRIVTEEGLLMSLPTAGATTASLLFYEENKDDAIGSFNNFNATVAWTTDAKTTVSATTPAITDYEVGDTEEYVYYVASDLATKLAYNKEPDQDTLEIEYHGGEVTGNVWITAPGVVAGSALVVKDTELTAAQKASNLVVVGGPAVNTIAAQLLDLAFPTYGTDATSGFSPGMAMIKTFEGKLTPGKVALLVAGYEKDDTAAAAKALIAEKKFGTLKTTSASAYTYA